MKKKFPIPGNFIYQYYQRLCPHWVYLTCQGKEKTSPFSPLESTFIQKGIQREERYFQLLKEKWGDECIILKDVPEFTPEENLKKRAKKTRQLMKQGVAVIGHAFLDPQRELRKFSQRLRKKYQLPFLPLLRGEPDLLFRISPSSEPPLYAVADVKTSYYTKLPQVMQVAYYSFLLSHIQGSLPPYGVIVLQNKEGDFVTEAFSVEEPLWLLRHFLEEELWEWHKNPKVFYHIHSRCRSCPFEKHCRQKAIEEKDLSLLPELKRHEKQKLLDLGISHLEALAQASSLTPLFTPEETQLLRLQAKAFLEKRPFPRPPERTPQEILEELTTFIHLDSEYRAYRHHFRPEQHSHTFLIVLEEPYVGTLLLGWYPPKGSPTLYADFGQLPPLREGLKLLEKHLQNREPHFLIHYGHSSARALRRWATREQKDLEEWLTHHLVDWKKVLQRLLILPCSANSLEEVAQSLGLSPSHWQEELSVQFSHLPHLEEALSSPLSLLFRLYWESDDEGWLRLLQKRIELQLLWLKQLYHYTLQWEDSPSLTQKELQS